jgi:hypothetical protein
VDFEPTNPEPIDPSVIDASAGSVFTGERKGISRWTPKWGGSLSRLDVILFAAIALFALFVVALILL